jgi:hypothetical protein
MLKTQHENKLWFVTQPDHAQVAGYLAAHWGNEAFARPGFFGEVPDPERLRAEVVLAVVQHDNGWWEWEASPRFAEADGLPAGLPEFLQDQQEGMNRWRIGLDRFPDRPYVNLLISHHAYHLYMAKLRPTAAPEFVHSLFWKGSPEELFPGNREDVEQFVAELQSWREQWTNALRADASTASWVEPDILNANGRLLQLLDGLSLALCSALVPARVGEAKGLGQDAFPLPHVPRQSWQDRVTIEVMPAGERRVVLDPYPFDVDPLPVCVPARIFDGATQPADHYATWWNAQPAELIEFVYASR